MALLSLHVLVYVSQPCPLLLVLVLVLVVVVLVGGWCAGHEENTIL
jgi:hypothetical protein